MGNGLKLGELDPGTVKVTAVRLGDGCSEYCISCGAYPAAEDREDGVRAVTVMEVDEARIREMLEREVDGSKAIVGDTRLKLVGCFARYVTTDVNQEPLNSDAFGHFMRLVKELSGGKSRAVCVSHGLRLDVHGKPKEDSARRLNEIVAMLDQQDVFVLSLDMARSQGKFGQSSQNLSSYVETLDRLRPALKKKTRITVSIQGVEDSTSPLHKGKAYELCGKVLAELKAKRGWSEAEIAQVILDDGRAWVGVGRSESLPGVNPAGECPVIPDTPLVAHDITRSQAGVVLNGVLDAVSGRLFAHPHNIGRGYNDLARLSRALSDDRAGKTPIEWGSWQEVYVNDTAVNDLTEAFRACMAAKIAKGRVPGVVHLPVAGAGGAVSPGRATTLRYGADPAAAGIPLEVAREATGDDGGTTAGIGADKGGGADGGGGGEGDAGKS